MTHRKHSEAKLPGLISMAACMLPFTAVTIAYMDLLIAVGAKSWG